MKLLHVDSSILGPGSVSRHLSASIVAQQQALHPDIDIVRRDLATDPVDHLTGLHLAAAQGAVPESGALQADVATGQAVLEEFLAADVVVVGAPLYNFTISSQLKAWLDRLAVAGKTFAYSEAGPQGLAGGKKVIVASARGGIYSAGPMVVMDFQETYLHAIFGFFGIKDVEIVRAEGLLMGPEQKQQAVEAALNAIPAVVRQAGTALKAA